MIRAAIIGATGYTGVELMRLLAGHPGVELAAVTSRSEAGRPVTEVFPSLRGVTALAYTDPDTEALADCDVVFFATPNGTAMQTAPALLERGVKVIDLSADFRLRDAREWEHWYGMQHACPELLAEAIYGLPEMNRQRLCGARLVANPGCYPTAVQLGFLPLLEAGLVDPASLVADAKSGVSGAGRKASIPHLYAEASESFTAYGVSGHRHLPEIVQGLNSVSTGPVGLVFVPHLVPMIRGIHATLYARLTDTAIDLTALYSERYRDEPFVDVLPAGSHVNTASVRGTNLCRIACHRPGNGATAVILAVEDNLVKGAAGQAIQNLNIMFGLDEQAGLDLVACCP